MSISSEITRISQNVANSLTAVASKGATVPSGSNSDDLPTLIASLPSTKSVTYNLTGGASASVTPAKAIAGQGFSLKLSAPTGYVLSGVTVTMGGVDVTSPVFEYDETGDSGGGGSEPVLQTKTVSYTPSASAQTDSVTADSGYDGLEQVNVSVGAIPSEYVVPSGTKTISANGTGIDVTEYASVDVAVPTSGAKFATGTYTPSQTYSSTGNRAICTISEIGFTPTKFLLAVNNTADIYGTQYAILRTSYEAAGTTVHYMRLYTRYSNTSGSLGHAGNTSNWTTQTNGYLYLSNGTIYYRTVSNCILVGNVTYTWYAYE